MIAGKDNACGHYSHEPRTHNPQKMVLTYTEAVKTVQPALATGKPHSLWTEFAKFYEKHGDVNNARVIYEKACPALPSPSPCFRTRIITC